MKIGNLSQSIVPVPNFFINRDIRKIDAFKIYKNKKRTYRDRDLFTANMDLNINHNPRVRSALSRTSSQKYIPLYNRGNYPSNSEEKGTYFPHIIDNSMTRQCNRTSSFIYHKNLREEIMNNTNSLLDRINGNYYTEKFAKTTFNDFYKTAYSPITDYIKNNESNKEKFNRTLLKKSNSLKMINPQAKNEIMKNIDYKEENEKKNINDTVLDEMLNTCKLNILKIKK